jgi:hypothetical protein
MKADIQITVKVIFSLQDLLNEKTILFFCLLKSGGNSLSDSPSPE